MVTLGLPESDDHQPEPLATPSASITPDRMNVPDNERPEEPSKRDKRRAKEAKKKAAEDAEKQAFKDLKRGKARSVPDTTAQQNEKLRKSDEFVFAKKKGKGRAPEKAEAEVISEEKIAKAVENIKAYRLKLVERWAENWTREFCRAEPRLNQTDVLATIYRIYAPLHPAHEAKTALLDLQILCLGLGKPCSDRSAQIQLALLLELSAGLQVGVIPVQIVRSLALIE